MRLTRGSVAKPIVSMMDEPDGGASIVLLQVNGSGDDACLSSLSLLLGRFGETSGLHTSLTERAGIHAGERVQI